MINPPHHLQTKTEHVSRRKVSLVSHTPQQAAGGVLASVFSFLVEPNGDDAFKIPRFIIYASQSTKLMINRRERES